MLEGLALSPTPRALDAGCGYGATMLDLAPSRGGRWTGLTLSPIQAERGMAQVTARDLVGRVRIEVGSYDEPPPGRYDLIYGIESLIHSADPAHTIRNLASALDPGGYLVIVDDMPVESMPAEAAARLARFKKFWRCPVAPTRAGWVGHLEAAGLTLVAERDLNPLLRVRSMAQAAPRLAELKRKSFLPRLIGGGVRCEAEIGGILLETLQTDGFVHYRILVAQRK
jgi:cyclopropane fatty-acyl-phospholipid synthase-like methyltransferase